MRQDHTFWCRGRARCENDFDHVGGSDIFGTVVFCRMTDNFLRQSFKCQFWVIKISVIDVTAAENQCWSGLFTNTLYKIDRTLFVQRNDDRATQNNSVKCGDPLWRVLCPDQNAITMSDAARFELAGKLKCCARDLRVCPSFSP